MRTQTVSISEADEASVQAAMNEAARSDRQSRIGYDALMQANLTRVFGERDADRRMVAIRELYNADAVLYEPHGAAKGHVAICEAVTALLARLPPKFVFTALGPAIGHHGIGRLQWSSGEPGHVAAATGMDVAHFQAGGIHSLFVFINPPGT